jgi:hypothetical protein
VGNPNRSPYIPGTVPNFLQQQVDAQQNGEVARYTALINDPNIPVTGLEIITNEPRAVPYFQTFLTAHGTAGHIVVVPYLHP